MEKEYEEIKKLCAGLELILDGISQEPTEEIKTVIARQLAEIVAVTRKTYSVTSWYYATAEFDAYDKHRLNKLK